MSETKPKLSAREKRYAAAKRAGTLGPMTPVHIGRVYAVVNGRVVARP